MWFYFDHITMALKNRYGATGSIGWGEGLLLTFLRIIMGLVHYFYKKFCRY